MVGSKGFVTIATGDERYYHMERTLLRSYRQTSAEPVRFAVIADRENEYTSEFDDVVILEKPTNSWLDKLQLLQCCPYEENLFFDADCIIYRDINSLWDRFGKADDFSCFGAALPLDADWGWFTSQAAEIYPIHFITHLHGICYFIRRGETIKQMSTLCSNIMENYHKLQFRQFAEQMADEPIFALAMAVMNLKPISAEPDDYCFVPCATKLSTDYLTRNNVFSTPWDGKVENGAVIHWGNENTKKALYRVERHKIDYIFCKGNCAVTLWETILYRMQLLRVIYQLQDAVAFCVGCVFRQWKKCMAIHRKQI